MSPTKLNSDQRLVVTGDWNHEEFSDFFSPLEDDSIFLSFEDAVEFLDKAEQPIANAIIASPRPGRFSQSQVEQICQVSPFTNFFALLGGWCEGETRTGFPWKGINRVYWHQQSFFRETLKEENDDTLPVSRLPRTFSTADMTIWMSNRDQQVGAGLVGIIARDWDTYEGIAECCHLHGFSTHWLEDEKRISAKGFDAIVCDIPFEIEALINQWGGYFSQNSHTPIVALASFPRRSCWKKLHQCGNVEVLSKPYDNAALVGTLINVVKTRVR